MNKNNLVGGLLLLGFALYFLYYAVIVAIIVICIGLFVWLIIKLIRYLYIGSVKNPSADPLFDKAAKWAAGKKCLHVSELSQRFAVHENRGRFIHTQLELSNILDGTIVKIHNKWNLGKIFRDINKEENYFRNRIKETGLERETFITKQLMTESDPRTVFLLNAYVNHFSDLSYMSYLIEEEASTSPDNNIKLQDIRSQIKECEELCKDSCVDLSTNLKHGKVYDKFCTELFDINNGKVWDYDHLPIFCEKGNFPLVRNNGQVYYVPCIKSSGNKRCYFYPLYVVIVNNSKADDWFIKLIDYKSININSEVSYFTKKSWFNSDDVQVAFHSYLHERKDGGPDLRYKYNPSIAYYQFVTTKWSGLEITLIFPYSNKINSINDALKEMKIYCQAENAKASSKDVTLDVRRKNLTSQSLSSQYSESISGKITNAIVTFGIKEESVNNRTLAYILNDCNVFQTVEEKVYFRLLKELINSGTMEKILCANPSTNEIHCIIEFFVKNTGYDSNMINSISTGVYNGFKGIML